MNYQSQWYTVKAVLSGKYIALNVYIRKNERSEFNHLSFHLGNWRAEEQSKENKVEEKKS